MNRPPPASRPAGQARELALARRSRAIQSDDPAALTRLIRRHGAPWLAHHSSAGHTGLTQAVYKNRPRTLRVMLAAIIDATDDIAARRALIDGRNCVGCTPARAATPSRPEMLDALIKAGADPNGRARGDTSLVQAAIPCSDPSPLRVLLAAGADPNHFDPAEHPPLHRAASFGRLEHVKALLAASADVEALTPEGGGVLHSADLSKPEIVERLIAAGAPVNARTTSGATALQAAALAGHNESLRLLLTAGADTEAQDEFDRTALLIAAAARNRGGVRALIAYGADVNHQDRLGLSALHYLASGELSTAGCEILLHVLRCGANPSLADEEGLTPLDTALECGAPHVAEALETWMRHRHLAGAAQPPPSRQHDSFEDGPQL